MTGADGGTERVVELAANLVQVRSRIEAACRLAGRAVDGVALIAVTKTWPLADIATIAGLGQRDMGENRDQEAAPKARARPDLRWHFLGGLQTNKALRVGTYASVVHSLDRIELVAPLARGAGEMGHSLDVLIQISLDNDPTRGGVAAGTVVSFADAVAQHEGVRTAGVMAVAPLDWEPARAFERVAEASARLVADHPQATEISTGMSADLEVAISYGSTMVRVGSAIFGVREAPVG